MIFHFSGCCSRGQKVSTRSRATSSAMPSAYRSGPCLRARSGESRRSFRAACSSRRRIRAGVCGPRSFALRRLSARFRCGGRSASDSMGTPSVMPRRYIRALTRSPPNTRIRSSSSERKKREEPGSPWRPARPRKLVVDAARFVPFGAENVQAAEGDDFIVLARHCLANWS